MPRPRWNEPDGFYPIAPNVEQGNVKMDDPADAVPRGTRVHR